MSRSQWTAETGIEKLSFKYLIPICSPTNEQTQAYQGTLAEGECSVRLTSYLTYLSLSYNIVKKKTVVSEWKEKQLILTCWYKEVNRADPSSSARIPWTYISETEDGLIRARGATTNRHCLEN